MNDFEFKPPDLESLYEVRHKVLRSGKPKKTAIFDGDKTALHFSLYQSGVAVAVLSCYRRSWDAVPYAIQYQLRGMAVLPEVQGQGLGARLLQMTERDLLTKHPSFMIWCNARVAAVDFYKKLGYITHGEAFDIPEVGIHYKMFKKC
ncbi:MAG: GNAT family N-acetyltransferase [Flavobacteriaceae bacterium]|nr:GNAT family N-acetyltransferase [Flavobacteriaceae bacterium]